MLRTFAVCTLILIVSAVLCAQFEPAQASDDSEGLSQLEVQRVIQRKGKSLKPCFDLVHSSQVVVQGQLQLSFKIGLQGRVKDLKVDAAGIANPAFVQSIAQKVSLWEFPFPRGGMDIDVEYPLVFKLTPGTVANTDSP